MGEVKKVPGVDSKALIKIRFIEKEPRPTLSAEKTTRKFSREVNDGSKAMEDENL